MPRNGANTFYRHPLARNVLLSDGVHDLAATGCWWLIDIIVLEGYPKLKRNPDAGMLIVKVKVKDSVASIQGKLYDDKPPPVAPEDRLHRHARGRVGVLHGHLR